MKRVRFHAAVAALMPALLSYPARAADFTIEAKNVAGTTEQYVEVTWPAEGNWLYFAEASETIEEGSWRYLPEAIVGAPDTLGVLTFYPERPEEPDTRFLRVIRTEDLGGDGMSQDNDYDDLPNAEEFANLTDPLNRDTDGDGLTDGFEVNNGLDPLDATGPNGAAGDPDEDDWTNLQEQDAGTHPKNWDTDGDGIADGSEAPGMALTNDAIADPDGVGLSGALKAKLIGRWDFETVALNGGQYTSPSALPGKPAMLLGEGLAQHLQAQGMPSSACMTTQDGFMRSSAAPFAGRQYFSTACWVQFPQAGWESVPAQGRTILAAGSDGTLPPVWRLALFPNRVIKLTSWWIQPNYTEETRLAEWVLPASITPGTWHHIALNVGWSPARRELAINGTLLPDVADTSQQFGFSSSLQPDSYFRVGGTRPALTGDFSGLVVDRLRLFSSPLSGAEIADLFHEDIDRDGLWDITEAKTNLWRDANSDTIASADEFGHIRSPFYWQTSTLDTDNDGATDLEEQDAGTSIGRVDTDGDLIPDGYELEHDLDPLDPADGTLDPDGDGLNNLAEWRYNTDPNAANSDGGDPNHPDNVNDGTEVSQGANPNDPTDGGVPAPPEQKLTFRLGVGDRSGSESEDYVLHCYRIDKETGEEIRVYTLRSGGFGEYVEETKDLFRRGETYTFQIQWQGSSLGYQSANPGQGIPAEGPDFDYHMVVEPLTSGAGILIDSWHPASQVLNTGQRILDPQDVNPTDDDDDNVAESAADFTANFEMRRVVFLVVDLDIDSDNDNQHLMPDRTEAEDAIEDNATSGGKSALVNDEDSDADWIPGYADGYGISPNRSECALSDDSFVPMVLHMPLRLASQSLRISYEWSDPNLVAPTGTGEWTLPAVGGRIRIWTSDGDLQRSAIQATSDQAGILVPGAPFSPHDLGADNGGLLNLFVECVRPSDSAGDIRIALEFDHEGEWVELDAVRMTSIDMNLYGREFDTEVFSRRSGFTRSDLAIPADWEGDLVSGQRPGGMMEHRLQIVDRRSSAANVVSVGGEAIALNGSSGDYWTDVFVVVDPTRPLDIQWSGLTVWPQFDAEGSIEVAYNPEQKFKFKGRTYTTPEGYNAVADAIKDTVEAMETEGWSPQNLNNPGEFGAEVHNRVSSRFAGRNGWIANLCVTTSTLEVQAGPGAGRTQIDLLHVDAGYNPQVGDTLDQAKIKNLFEIKSSVSGSVGQDQLDRLRAIGGKDIVSAKTPKRWTPQGYEVNKHFRTGFRVLGVIGAAATAYAWLNHASYDDELAEIQELFRRAQVLGGASGDLVLAEARIAVHNYLTHFVDPTILSLSLHRDVVKIMTEENFAE